MSAARGPIALIGGTGLNNWAEMSVVEERSVDTPYGAPSAALRFGTVCGAEVCFLARHGDGHKIPPHAINYRANLWALKHSGVSAVVAVAAVGSLDDRFEPGAVALPNDLIDYTWGRAHSYSDTADDALQHVEMTPAYATDLRNALHRAAQDSETPLLADGVLGVTQGPRLETAAEVRRLRRDGCTMVGMTGMPEAALARELDLPYACLAVSVNWGAGMVDGDIHAQIEASIASGMSRVQRILAAFLSA